MTALLQCVKVSKRFPGVQALRDVDLEIVAGEVHALVGQNGAGKSTLVKCICGVHAPDSGRIVFDGAEIAAYTPKHAYELGIEVVHQRPQLLPYLSVAENVMLGHFPTSARGLRIDRARANDLTWELLERLHLDIDPEAPVVKLAVPERQQVAIARALFRRAKLLILDEPTAALDAARATRLFELVGDLTAEGVGVLYVSHHLEEVFALADRITVLRDGERVATTAKSELTQSDVVTMMAGRRLESVTAAGARDGNGKPVILSVDRLSTDVLHGVSFDVHEGEVVGITGVIGAGGHDVARVLFGLDRARHGQLLLHDRPYEPRGPSQAIDAGVFVAPEDTAAEGLVPPLSVAKNVTLVDLPGITRAGSLLSLKREREEAAGYVGDLHIQASSLDAEVRTLSGGNQQKVLIAKALAAGADVLVLEEPTQGVDVHAKAEIHRIVRDLAAGGKAVLVISTDIRDLLLFVDRVLALRDGRVAGELSARDTNYAEVLDLTVGSIGANAP